MLPATSWEELDWTSTNSVRGWSVMERLRERQQNLEQSTMGNESARGYNSESLGMMTPAASSDDLYKILGSSSRFSSERTVLAFLFTQPDSAAIAELDRKGRHFDRVTGTEWDLFFPGYFLAPNASPNDPNFDPVGSKFTRNWFFDESGFDQLTEYIQDNLHKHWKDKPDQSKPSWRYSGETDLVIMETTLTRNRAPHINWGSTVYGSVDSNQSLSKLIHSIADDLKLGKEDPNFGVGRITVPESTGSQTHGRLVGIQDAVLAAILTDIILKLFGG